LELDPAAWLEVLEGLVHEMWPVGDGTGEEARVDEVEGFTGVVGPSCFDIVDVEVAVWRDGGRHCGREIVAYNRCAGEVLGEIDGPYTGAGAEIEDSAAEVGRERSEEEMVLHCEEDEVMVYVKAV